MSAHDRYCPVTQIPDRSPACVCIQLASARTDTADAIRDRVMDYRETLTSHHSRAVALNCAALANTAGLS